MLKRDPIVIRSSFRSGFKNIRATKRAIEDFQVKQAQIIITKQRKSKNKGKTRVKQAQRLFRDHTQKQG